MRVLYGVVGEGMGHATHSKVIIEHLAARHEVEVAASGRARGFLEAAFPALPVHAIHGLTILIRLDDEGEILSTEVVP